MNWLNRIIRYSFYSLFFLVPIVFTNNTSELFEFNKLWLTFGLTTIIVATWISKMILERRIIYKRTPLDIPILLFLASQTISTIFSIDPRVSLWGYYSRFNGGLLSLVTYALLYFAFVSNAFDSPINLNNNARIKFAKKFVIRSLLVTLSSGIFVSLWGLPSHFGYDPTCLLFRGTLDVSCWTFAFQPKVRIFSTLGQPDWLAAYLAMLLPITIAFGLNAFNKYQTLLQNQSKNNKASKLPLLKATGYLLIAILFYLDLLFTKARSGFIAAAISLFIFFVWYIWVVRKQIFKPELSKIISKQWYLIVMLFSIGIISFIIGTSITQLDRFSLVGLRSYISSLQQHTPTPVITQPKAASPAPVVPTQELGGTDSGKIRLYVWTGAIDVFLHHPVFGTGVETFAFAYYLYRPVGHNMTSEWEYLYNKAHNEFLNYLATTGAIGLGTYLLMLGWFLWIAIKNLNNNIEFQNSKQLQNTNNQNAKHLDNSSLSPDSIGVRDQSESMGFRILIAALIAGYISILITNFFGFSVVIMNIYLFIIPAFILILENAFKIPASSADAKAMAGKQIPSTGKSPSPLQWIGITVVALISLWSLGYLFVFWEADISYALGYNLDHAGANEAASVPLHDAAKSVPSEPTFQDELAVNDAVLAMQKYQADASLASSLLKEAVDVNTNIVTLYPNNITYWKSRVRIFYILSQLDSRYLPTALEAIQKTSELAPTDAKVMYNLGLLYGQNQQLDKGLESELNAVKLKPNYTDAYYALALFYHEEAVDTKGKVVNPATEQKAVDTMHFILDNLSNGQPNKQVSDTLKTWGAH